MSRIRPPTATPFGAKDERRRQRRRRRFSRPAHDAQSKCSQHSSAHSTRTASGTVTAAAMMVVLAVTLLGATAPRAVSAGWVDPDTPQEAMTTLSLVDNTEYELVSRVESNGMEWNRIESNRIESNHVLFCLKVEKCQMPTNPVKLERFLLSASLISFTYSYVP